MRPWPGCSWGRQHWQVGLLLLLLLLLLLCSGCPVSHHGCCCCQACTLLLIAVLNRILTVITSACCCCWWWRSRVAVWSLRHASRRSRRPRHAQLLLHPRCPCHAVVIEASCMCTNSAACCTTTKAVLVLQGIRRLWQAGHQVCCSLCGFTKAAGGCQVGRERLVHKAEAATAAIQGRHAEASLDARRNSGGRQARGGRGGACWLCEASKQVVALLLLVVLLQQPG
jgi:hypothetical protein